MFQVGTPLIWDALGHRDKDEDNEMDQRKTAFKITRVKKTRKVRRHL